MVPFLPKTGLINNCELHLFKGLLFSTKTTGKTELWKWCNGQIRRWFFHFGPNHLL